MLDIQLLVSGECYEGETKSAKRSWRRQVSRLPKRIRDKKRLQIKARDMPSLQDSEETSHERTMMPPVDSLIPMDAEIEKAPQLASVEENPTTDVQKESQMEDIPEER